MTNHPSFGVLLARLLKHRGTNVTWLSTASGVTEPEVRSVIDGAPPSGSQLRALAPALGFHAADLFVIAGVSLPEDLAPLDRAAGEVNRNLVKIMMALPPGERRRIHRLVGDLPQQPRSRDEPVKPLRTFNQREAGFGAMLVSLLCNNRNLHSQFDAAWTVGVLTRGRMCLSGSTYMRMGRGLAPLRPHWVVGFATTLGVPAGDLAAITGTELPDEPLRDDPVASETAELIWNLRRLSAAQARQVLDEANAMLVAVPENASDREWNRVHHHHGVWWGAPRTDGG